MELLTLDKNCAQTSISIEKIYLPDLGDRIIQSPESFIFLLSSKEWKEFMRQYHHIKESIVKLNTQVEKENKFEELTNEYGNDPLTFIITISSHPAISKSHRIACLTPSVLGNCFAVFFTDPFQITKRFST